MKVKTKFNSITSKLLKLIIIILLIELILICGCFIFDKCNTYISQKQSEERSIKYSETYSSAVIAMQFGASTAKVNGFLLQDVWYNSIYQKKDDTTDIYTRKNNGKGAFYDDFNDALVTLYNSEDYSSQVNIIKETQEKAELAMKELVNPPKGWEEAYDAIKKYYSIYVHLTNMIVFSGGSYNSFTEDFNKYSTEERDQNAIVHIYI